MFVRAHRKYYAFDLAPSWWEEIIKKAHEGSIRSIDKVEAELNPKKNKVKGEPNPKEDELTKWINENFKQWFEDSMQDDVLKGYAEVIEWAESKKQYVKEAKDKFAKYSVADAWIVAHAKVKGYTVVTQEESSPDSKSSIKIPDVCKGLNVECIDTFQMMHNLRISI